MVSNGYTSKCSGPYLSSPPLLFFDIPALWGAQGSLQVRRVESGVKSQVMDFKSQVESRVWEMWLELRLKSSYVSTTLDLIVM